MCAFISSSGFSYLEQNNTCIVNYWYCTECSDVHKLSDLQHVQSCNIHCKQSDVHCYRSSIAH